MTTNQGSGAGDYLVVGTDGSASATNAVLWAAQEAARRAVRLRVVHGYVWSLVVPPLGGGGYLESGDGLREAAERLLADAEAAAVRAVPDLEVETTIVEDTATAALLRASADAVMVVVGSRGLGGFSGLVVGSTAVQLTMYATCPVVVVRDATDRAPDAPVVVGVDGSDHATRALGFAFEAAALRNAPLLAIHAWTEPVATAPGDMIPPVYDPELVHRQKAEFLNEQVSAWSAKYPDVAITQQVIRGHPSATLVEASKRAQLLVVGARGVGGFRGLLFGSISQAAIHHAHCPVAVIRVPKQR